MKNLKVIGLVIMLTAIGFSAKSQQEIELQFHYDLGSYERSGNLGDGTPFTQDIKRDDARIRFQMLGKDSLGTYFINGTFNFSGRNEQHLNSGASFQIIRGIKVSKKSYFEIVGAMNGSTAGGSNLYFAGIHHPLKFGKLVLLPVLFYSYKAGDDNVNMRYLMGYRARLFENKILIFGFVNYWTRDLFDGTPFGGKKGGFQANPQVYYNLTNQIGLGTEIDISYHRYSPDKSILVLPSASLRWKF